MTLVSGAAIDLTVFDGGWPFIGVDYGNLGSEADPPPLDYVNEVDDTVGGQIGVLLPLSAEGIVVASGNSFIQYINPLWV